MTDNHRLSAKRVRELLALRRIHNDFVLIGDTEGRVPFLEYRNASRKSNITAAWQVVTPGRSTNVEGHYRDNFNQTFEVTDARLADARNDALNAALAWAGERYGLDQSDWIKTPFGGYTSKQHLGARLRELLPREFDPSYRDPAVKKVADKLADDADADEGMFRVVVTLYTVPEPPLYVRAADADGARRQVTQLFTRLAGTRVLDGLKLNVYDA